MAELTDEKSKFRQWDTKFASALAHVEKSYGWALERIKECVDEGGEDEEDIRVMLTLGEGAEKHRLDVEQLSSDLEFILVDKAKVGSDILHRVNNARPRGGVMMYAEVYRWFA